MEHLLEQDYTVQQYITVFWFANTKNNFVPTLLKKVNEINKLNMNEIKQNIETFKEVVSSYDLYIDSIKNLRECLKSLLKQSVFDTFEKYDTDFLEKVDSIHKQLVNNNINVPFDKFKSFMYSNTCEGRIIKHNMYALSILYQIKNVEDLIKNLKQIFQ